MQYRFSEIFLKRLESFPISIQNKFWRQLDFLLVNLRYSSLHAKKYDESRDIWQGRVDKNIRFYFLIRNDVYVLLDIKKHPK